MKHSGKVAEQAVKEILAGATIAQMAERFAVSESLVKQWLTKHGVSLKKLESTGGGSLSRIHLLVPLVGKRVTAAQAAQLLGIKPHLAWWLLDAGTTRVGRVTVRRISGRLDDSIFEVRWT